MEKENIKDLSINLGYTLEEGFILSFESLKRHVLGFGSSGSGKTVAFKCLIEELALRNVPVIAIDPQGDIASLGLTASDEDLKKHNIPLNKKNNFEKSAEVVVWTPGSIKGIPLSTNPIEFDEIKTLNDEERTKYLFYTARNICFLAGYEPDSDDCKTVEILLNILFEHCIKNNIPMDSLSTLVTFLGDIPEDAQKKINSISSPKIISSLIKKIKILTLGANRLMFEKGTPLNIDKLLGLDGSTKKTRISVIYLNSLNSFKEKDFFISELTKSLHQWMLKKSGNEDSSSLKCGFFIDEISPYIPPVKVTSSKIHLENIFRQGRKYGLVNLIASQSPGDIDYKAIGQFSSVILGALNTKQDIDKIKTRLNSVVPDESDDIIKELPSLNPGQFIGISPDNYEKAKSFKVRWLITKHEVILDKDIKNINTSELENFYKVNSNSARVEKSFDEIQSNENSSTDNGKSGKILIAKNNIIERDLRKKISKHINGFLLLKESFVDSTFNYLPLIQVTINFRKREGFLGRRVKEVTEKLYLDFKSHQIFFVDNNIFKFSNVVDKDPNDILDLDNFCTFESVNKKDIDFDFRSLGGKKLNKVKIKNVMERKYRVRVISSCMVLFPSWLCRLEAKKDKKKHRFVCLDGIFGNVIKL